MTTDVLSPTSIKKRCSICGEGKRQSEFYKRSRSPDGLQRHCRACSRQSLDAAEARRRQPQPIATDLDTLAALIAARAEDVADFLLDVADTGDPYALYALADLLEPQCPVEDTDDPDAPACLLHDLGGLHEMRLAERYPTVAAAAQACGATRYVSQDAAEASESEVVPGCPTPA